MKRMAVTAGVVLVLSAYGTSFAHGVTIVVTREENKPKSVEIVEGDQVHWTNASGGTAHLSFRGDDAIQFSLGTTDHVIFDKAGTYTYTVHIGGTKAHAHTGTILVKPR